MMIASRVLMAAQLDHEFIVAVHLDTTQVVPPEGVDPQLSQERIPDPDWCVEYRFTADGDPNMLVAQALLTAKQALIDRLKACGRPIPHPVDGKVLDLLALTGTGNEPRATSHADNGGSDRTLSGMPRREGADADL